MDAADLVRLVRETGSPYGVDPLPPVGAAVREALQTEARGTTDFVYVPSCESVAFDPSVLISAVSVLQSAGVGVRVVHPSCCGALLRDRGPAAAEFREAVAEAIALADGRRVVAEAGGCAEYLGAEPFAVVAAELLESGLLRPRRVEAKVPFHPPCAAGADGRIAECGVRIAAAVFGPHEVLAGSCEGTPSAPGADLVVTSAPECKRRLRAAGASARDVSEVLAVAL